MHATLRNAASAAALALVVGACGLPEDTSTPALDAAVAAAAAAPAPVQPASAWRYAGGRDDLTGEPVALACTLSTNTIELEWPYESQRLEMCVRSIGGDQDVMIFLPKGGQFVGYESTFRVRMDSRDVSRVEVNRSNDDDSAWRFVRNEQWFIAALRQSEEIAIEAVYYQAGAQTAVFNTAGLEWPREE